jgi:hypothetical protein
MPASNRPLGDAQSRTHWGEPKRCRSLSMTDHAWDILTKIASVQGMARSEAMERLIRKAWEWTDAPVEVDQPTQVR